MQIGMNVVHLPFTKVNDPLAKQMNRKTNFKRKRCWGGGGSGKCLRTERAVPHISGYFNAGQRGSIT